jgi:hypothetical protein
VQDLAGPDGLPRSTGSCGTLRSADRSGTARRRDSAPRSVGCSSVVRQRKPAVPGVYGVPDAWPHIQSLLAEAGFDEADGQVEVVFAGALERRRSTSHTRRTRPMTGEARVDDRTGTPQSPSPAAASVPGAILCAASVPISGAPRPTLEGSRFQFPSLPKPAYQLARHSDGRSDGNARNNWRSSASRTSGTAANVQCGRALTDLAAPGPARWRSGFESLGRTGIAVAAQRAGPRRAGHNRCRFALTQVSAASTEAAQQLGRRAGRATRRGVRPCSAWSGVRGDLLLNRAHQVSEGDAEVPVVIPEPWPVPLREPHAVVGRRDQVGLEP